MDPTVELTDTGVKIIFNTGKRQTRTRKYIMLLYNTVVHVIARQWEIPTYFKH